MYVDNIGLLFDKYENIDIKTMGFPENCNELFVIYKSTTNTT